MAATTNHQETAAVDLGALLDAGDGTIVTLMAGETRLAAHKAVLVSGSPVVAAMFSHNMQETSNGEVILQDVEGLVLRQLIAYLYTGRVTQLPGMALQLLAAADKYGVNALKDACEQQLAEKLDVESAAAAAVVAVRHSCHNLMMAAITFIKAHNFEVLGTLGWAEAVHHHPTHVVEVSRLLAEPRGETSAPAIGPTAPATCHTTPAAGSTAHAANPTATPQPCSDHSQTPATSAPPPAVPPTPQPDDAAISCLWSLSGEERNSRLLQAAKQGSVEDVRTLLAAGADVLARDREGDGSEWTALHHAARNGHVDTAWCLLQAGAGVDTRTRVWQSTPLHLATMSGHTAVMRLLLASSADLNARNKNGRTPLHIAALNGKAEAATALLEAGADTGSRDGEGKTALDCARQNNCQHLIQMLQRII